ncbi:MAG: ABC transporter substrate-binding protein [Ruminococcus sp.]|nr:ABC transporter substrate-binding protein [Ruminococcus sp.]
MKKLIAALLAVTLVFTLAACSGGKTDDTSKKDITLCLDWTPNTNHTGFYVASAKGYYEEAGLNVSIVQPAESSASLMCASGKAQFAIEFQDTLTPAFTQEQPLDVTAVAALLQHNTSGIISRKGDGITSPKGLEGKTYNTWDSPIEQAIIKTVMEKDGGDFSKVKLVKEEIYDEASALKNKDVDAIWIFYAWGGISAELREDFDFDYFDFISYDKVFDYYSPIIIANNDFLKNDPETAKAFLAATKKGYEYAIENPEDAAKILVEGDTTGSLNDSLELVTASQKWIADQYIADAESWGVIDPARWDGFYSWLWENKLIDVELKPGTGFTNDYLS